MVIYLTTATQIADTKDPGLRKRLALELPPMPEPFSMLRTLRNYGGGNVAFLEAGGYLDQPYLSSLELETCMNAEKEFMATAQALKDFNAQQTQASGVGL